MYFNFKEFAQDLLNRRPAIMPILFLLGPVFLLMRALLDSSFRNTTLVYIAVPFGISILLHVLTFRAYETSTLWRYLNHMRDATIIMLATSAFLFEGFVCVVMFMPIYYFFVTLGFFFNWLIDRQRASNSHKLGAYGVTAIIAFVCLEGFVEPLTMQRTTEATYSMVVEGDIETLKNRMAQPIAFEGERHWFLSVFPLPVSVEAGSLKAGDVHRLRFVYNRWFFTNTHEGEMKLRIASVGDDFVRTEILKNTSYLASYMTLKGTEVQFEAIDDGRTNVSLTIEYDRLLDPYWYFGPLQHFAAELSAKYLIETVIERGPAHG